MRALAALVLVGSVAHVTEAKLRKEAVPAISSTSTCGQTSIPLNSEEPSCNSHNGRWISVVETGSGGSAYWIPTPMQHPTFAYWDGTVGLPDQGTYLISTEIPVASDCGMEVVARLRINGVIVESQTSPGGNRILRHRFVYVKDGPESNTDYVQVTIETSGGGYAQGIVLDIQRTDVGI